MRSEYQTTCQRCGCKATIYEVEAFGYSCAKHLAWCVRMAAMDGSVRGRYWGDRP